MRLTTRLLALEIKLAAAGDPGVLIVGEDDDGSWHDGQGTTIDPATVDPRTQVIRFRQRPDGPR